MENQRLTDLPMASDPDRKIVLVQPRTMYQDTSPLPEHHAEILPSAFRDVIGMRGLVHVRSLWFNARENEHGGPSGLDSECGGLMKIGCPHERDKSLQERVQGDGLAITCSNPRCNARFRFQNCTTESDLANLLLHLMLKQVVPGLTTLNYADCSRRKEALDIGEVEDARSLGLISIATKCLQGYDPIDKYAGGRGTAYHYDLGFMLRPHMHGINGAGIHCGWLQMLIQKKFESLREFHGASAPALLGPKAHSGY